MNSNKPMAAKGLTSYRYPGRYGWIMIGAKDHQDAVNEANRSLFSGGAKLFFLEIWDADQGKYIRVSRPEDTPCHYTI